MNGLALLDVYPNLGQAVLRQPPRPFDTLILPEAMAEGGIPERKEAS